MKTFQMHIESAPMEIKYNVMANPSGKEILGSVLERNIGKFILYVLEEQLKREEEESLSGLQPKPKLKKHGK